MAINVIEYNNIMQGIYELRQRTSEPLLKKLVHENWIYRIW